MVENSSTVKWRNKVNNKRDKWNKGEWKVSILSTEDNKLREPPKISLQYSRDEEDVAACS